MKKNTILTALSLCVCAVVVSACGIPTQQTARSITSSQVPFHLLSPIPPTSTPTTAVGYVQEKIFLTSTGQNTLRPVERYVAPPVSLTDVVNALLRGPTTAEQQTGIETALNRSVHLYTAHVQNEVATLNLNTAFARISGPLAVLAVAQIVFTVAAQLGQSIAVSFEINGFLTQVPDGSGALLSRPVKVGDYPILENAFVTPPSP
jgi:hypothetical protein